jgi:phosphoenolpyruvate carboxykinase (ATP)
MDINHTRSMVRAALDGRLDGVPTVTDPIFGVEVPTSCPDVPAEFLQPRATWADSDAYDHQARALAHMFAENFAAYADGVSAAVRAAGPRVVDADAPDLPVAGPGEG